MISSSQSRFNNILFRRYRRHGRHSLPWRHTHDPYRILVSEVMLQQTRVERALLKYREFLRRFPTVRALARASLGDVLRAWSGLGYNRRAKFLHECAKTLIAMPTGRQASRQSPIAGALRWPQTFQTLVKLPGVGPSTAAAISSFSFGADEPMIDTNIRRIICRVFFRHRIPSDRVIYAFAKTLIPKGRGCEWNWAMMDVGALFCKARHHDDKCPFQTLHGPVEDFVYKKPQKKFAGSDRYYRGRILVALAAAHGGVARTVLHRKLAISEQKLSLLITTLRRESLVKVSGDKILLP